MMKVAARNKGCVGLQRIQRKKVQLMVYRFVVRNHAVVSWRRHEIKRDLDRGAQADH